MSIVVKQKHSLNYGIKVAFVIVVIFALVGLFTRITKKQPMAVAKPPQSLVQLLAQNSELLIPTIKLQIPVEAHEKEWTNALAELINGKTEVKLDLGRADILTDRYAIEVDFLPKWKEGLGQTICYANATNLIPVLAIIAPNPIDKDKLKQIEEISTKEGVKLLILTSE
ncbi:MAG: hypothetical protein LLF92_11335 [Planctomycetaceae bacterium]|nr:hypothetical protein [Planctomycetaceae bacterium]